MATVRTVAAGASSRAWAAWAADIPVVTQANRKFQPQQVEVARGGTIRFVNDDGQLLHHIYSTSPGFSFDSAMRPRPR